MKKSNTSNKGTVKYEPLVSIAIAIYNGERYLREQLDSLLLQTYSNIEIVVTDDSSSDSTQAILTEYAAKDNRLRWSISTRPRGMVSNFTGAVLLCRGEIIFLCDCDDVWYPEKVAKHVEKYIDISIEWIYNEAIITDENNLPTGHLTDLIPDYYTRRKLLYYVWGSCIIGCATSYRASLIQNRWPADALSSGHDSWIQLAIFPAKPFYLKEVLQDYRQHANNSVGLKGINKTPEWLMQQNMLYLGSLMKNRQLQSWKRFYFFAVLLGKKVRGLLHVAS